MAESGGLINDIQQGANESTVIRIGPVQPFSETTDNSVKIPQAPTSTPFPGYPEQGAPQAPLPELQGTGAIPVVPQPGADANPLQTGDTLGITDVPSDLFYGNTQSSMSLDLEKANAAYRKLIQDAQKPPKDFPVDRSSPLDINNPFRSTEPALGGGLSGYISGANNQWWSGLFDGVTGTGWYDLDTPIGTIRVPDRGLFGNMLHIFGVGTQAPFAAAADVSRQTGGVYSGFQNSWNPFDPAWQRGYDQFMRETMNPAATAAGVDYRNPLTYSISNGLGLPQGVVGVSANDTTAPGANFAPFLDNPLNPFTITETDAKAKITAQQIFNPKVRGLDARMNATEVPSEYYNPLARQVKEGAQGALQFLPYGKETAGWLSDRTAEMFANPALAFKEFGQLALDIFTNPLGGLASDVTTAVIKGPTRVVQQAASQALEVVPVKPPVQTGAYASTEATIDDLVNQLLSGKIQLSDINSSLWAKLSRANPEVKRKIAQELARTEPVAPRPPSSPKPGSSPGAVPVKEPVKTYPRVEDPWGMPEPVTPTTLMVPEANLGSQIVKVENYLTSPVNSDILKLTPSSILDDLVSGNGVINGNPYQLQYSVPTTLEQAQAMHDAFMGLNPNKVDEFVGELLRTELSPQTLGEALARVEPDVTNRIAIMDTADALLRTSPEARVLPQTDLPTTPFQRVPDEVIGRRQDLIEYARNLDESARAIQRAEEAFGRDLATRNQVLIENLAQALGIATDNLPNAAVQIANRIVPLRDALENALAEDIISNPVFAELYDSITNARNVALSNDPYYTRRPLFADLIGNIPVYELSRNINNILDDLNIDTLLYDEFSPTEWYIGTRVDINSLDDLTALWSVGESGLPSQFRNDMDELGTFIYATSDRTRAEQYARSIVRNPQEGVMYGQPRVIRVTSTSRYYGSDEPGLGYSGLANGEYAFQPRALFPIELTMLNDITDPVAMLQQEYNALAAAGMDTREVGQQLARQIHHQAAMNLAQQSDQLAATFAESMDDYQQGLADAQAALDRYMDNVVESTIDDIDAADASLDFDPCTDYANDIAGRVIGNLPATLPRRNDIRIDETIGGSRTYMYTTPDGNDVEVSIGAYDKSDSVNFTVNYSYDVGVSDTFSDQEKRRVALAVKRSFDYDVSTRPDGFRYDTSAYTGDTPEKGRDRVDAYELIGFSHTDNPGSRQFGIVVNGKLVPDTPRLREYLSSMSGRSGQASLPVLIPNVPAADYVTEVLRERGGNDAIPTVVPSPTYHYTRIPDAIDNPGLEQALETTLVGTGSVINRLYNIVDDANNQVFDLSNPGDIQYLEYLHDTLVNAWNQFRRDGNSPTSMQQTFDTVEQLRQSGDYSLRDLPGSIALVTTRIIRNLGYTRNAD
jgi:hypothetical protein